MPVLLSLFFLVMTTALAALAPPSEWIWVAMLCNAGSFAAYWWCRRLLPAALRLTASSFLIVFLLNYQVQIFLVDWLYHSPVFDSLWREFSLRRLDGSFETRAESIYLIAAVFGLVCSTVTGCAYAFREQSEPAKESVAGLSREGVHTLWVIFGFGLGASLIGLLVQMTFGVGALTAEQAFSGRLDGAVYHSLVTLAPLLFMAVHWEALRKRHTTMARLSLLAYGALGVAEMALMSSRGFIVLQMLPLALLYLWMGYSPRRMAGLALGTALLTVTLYPVITAVRNLRSVSGYGAMDSISAALSGTGEGRDMTANLVRMGARFIGYTSYLTSLENPDSRFDWSTLEAEKIVTLRESGFTRYFTEQIAGYGAGIRRHFTSPGLLGAAQVIGGLTMVILLPPLFVLLSMVGVRLLARPRWRLGPLVPVNVLASLLFLFEEGAFDLIFTRLLLVAIALTMLNWLFRLSVPDHAAA